MSRYFNQYKIQINHITVVYLTLGLIELYFQSDDDSEFYHCKLNEEGDAGKAIANKFIAKYKSALMRIETVEQFETFLNKTKNTYRWQEFPGWWKGKRF